MSAKIVIPIVGKHGGKYDIAKVVEWKAKEGDRVEKGSTVLVVETEKASCDVEAEASGFLHILVEEGGKAMVRTVVGFIAETKEELEKLQKTPSWELSQR
jgi:pyruvate dehydrogenase E2 component (dihydrolipoamide acetyltransferase)